MTRDRLHLGAQADLPALKLTVLEADVLEALRETLPQVADNAVTAIIEGVPSYTNALTGQMGETIRQVVQLALGGFLTLLTKHDPDTPRPPALEGAYQIGRGEARSGRSMEALLAAFRIGARVCWHDMSRVAVAQGIGADQLSDFAEMVFHYIDQLSEAAAAGHADELESTGRVRQRKLDRLTRALLGGAAPDEIVAAADRADWPAPGALTAVVLPESQVSHALTLLDPLTLQSSEEGPELPAGSAVLLIPGAATDAARRSLVRTLRGTDAVVGSSVPWLEVLDSYRRARRCLRLGLTGFVDSNHHLASLVLDADPGAREDLRRHVLAPLADLRPSTVDKLTETLRAWLLHQGRRESIAEALFVHPQTVRYRVSQLREAYGDQLEDPEFVRTATVALA